MGLLQKGRELKKLVVDLALALAIPLKKLVLVYLFLFAKDVWGILHCGW